MEISTFKLYTCAYCLACKNIPDNPEFCYNWAKIKGFKQQKRLFYKNINHPIHTMGDAKKVLNTVFCNVCNERPNCKKNLACLNLIAKQAGILKINNTKVNKISIFYSNNTFLKKIFNK